MSKEIRIINGRKVSKKSEVAQLNTGIFVGNSTNFFAHQNEVDLYDKKTEVFGPLPTYIDPQDLNRINLYVGGMGSGKSVVGDLMINSFPNARMLINDPKRERTPWAYDKDKDIIICAADRRGACLHIFDDLRKRKILITEVFKIMEASNRGSGNNQNAEWSNYMLQPVNLICDHIFTAMDAGATADDLYAVIATAYKKVADEYAVAKNKMMDSALNVAAPIFNALFQMYYIGAMEKRQWVSILDLAKYRRVFILGHPNFNATLKPINNAFLTMYAMDAMARDDVPSDKVTENLSFWILEEFLGGIDLDDNLLTEVVSQCRSKGISVHMFLQTLDKEASDKLRKLLSLIKTSRYLSFFFKTSDNVSAREIAESSGELLYEKRQDVANNKMFDFFSGDTESWSPVNSHTISTHTMMNLPAHVAFMQVDDRRKGTIRTFIKAPFTRPDATQPAFIESEVALNAPSLNVFISKMGGKS